MNSTNIDGVRYVRIDSIPPSFLPIDLDTTGFIDITQVGDAFRVLLDPATGKRYDSAVFMAEFEAARARLSEGKTT